ncbi:PREDICTED: 3'-5' ssDNA/RNA exonuclease TatD-like [Rhagoletis zephyria]|uniref:3'-5' ssDNA/RNA exonuclease TatD-like n=1 Tax=Rhagoletis zephyria TaxID=28612 RepID=UPI000811AA07|nr:PREDICTED: 3'-5' ssDNA/RNA exonuclease TatD-like [Rhagoletis zephyria]
MNSSNATTTTAASRLSESIRDLVSQDFSKLMLDIANPGHYLLIDIGANLTNRKFAKDLDAVLQRARDVGVCKILVTGTSISSSKDALRLSHLHPDMLYCTAGVHPHDAKQWTDDCEVALTELARNSECVAIGECGLDYNRDFSPRDVQQEVFEKQIQIACDLKRRGTIRPLFLHERDAHEDFVRILSKYRDQLPNVVVHCFSGTQEECKVYLEMGFYIGLTGYISKLKPDNGLMKMLEEKTLPIDRLMLETDSPYCYPNTRSNKMTAKVKETLTEKSLSHLNRYCSFQRNEPSSLPVTLEIVSSYLNMKPEDVAIKTTLNAISFFGISP